MAQTVSEAVINQLAEDIGDTCQQKGFWDQINPLLSLLNTKLLLVISEAIEAQDVLRGGPAKEDDSPWFLEDVLTINQANHFFEELADIVIRTLDLAGHYGWDLGETILQKVERNKSRAHRHGKAF